MRKRTSGLTIKPSSNKKAQTIVEKMKIFQVLCCELVSSENFFNRTSEKNLGEFSFQVYSIGHGPYGDPSYSLKMPEQEIRLGFIWRNQIIFDFNWNLEQLTCSEAKCQVKILRLCFFEWIVFPFWWDRYLLSSCHCRELWIQGTSSKTTAWF